MPGSLRITAACLGLALAAGPITADLASAQQPEHPMLGATVEGLRQAGRALSPALRAASLETEAADAKAGGAGALDDPTFSDFYQYRKNPSVFSAHTVMLSQSFPLWGKRSLRRRAALADVDAARGREQAARDETDERIKIAYAQWYAINRDIAVNRQTLELDRGMRAAAASRYGQGAGGQADLIRVMGEETSGKADAIRLEGERDAAAARLNVLAGRGADEPLADPARARAVPEFAPPLGALVDRARAGNPSLVAGTAELAASRTRRTLAAKAWYPDLTLGGGPIIQTNDRPVGFAATVSLNIPVGWGREASGEREAEANLGASEQRYAATLLEVEGALGEAAAKLRAARQTADLLRRESLPQARATFRATLAGYRQGRGDLATVIAAERLGQDVERRMLDVQLDEQVELAAIERLIGSDL